MLLDDLVGKRERLFARDCSDGLIVEKLLLGGKDKGRRRSDGPGMVGYKDIVGSDKGSTTLHRLARGRDGNRWSEQAEWGSRG